MGWLELLLLLLLLLSAITQQHYYRGFNRYRKRFVSSFYFILQFPIRIPERLSATKSKLQKLLIKYSQMNCICAYNSWNA